MTAWPHSKADLKGFDWIQALQALTYQSHVLSNISLALQV